MARAWIGTSDYNYPHWKADFYPAGMPERRWLPYYASVFDTVEINYSFYQLPAATTFRAWTELTPPGFRFVIKGSRFITHLKRLKDCRPHIEKLMDASRPLWDKMAVVLWQLPANQSARPERLDRFLRDARLVDGPTGLRHAFEFRNADWFQTPVYEVLSSHDAAMVWADAPFDVIGPGHAHRDGHDIRIVPRTASWAYVRRHGGDQHNGDYPPSAIENDARWIRRLARQADVHAYYNNDVGGYATRNAAALRDLVDAPRPTSTRGRRTSGPAQTRPVPEQAQE